MASSTEVKSVAPFSNHSCIPQPLRVLVAQTPFAHHTDAGTDSRQLLAQNDLDIAMKVSPSAILIPITYKMRSVGAEVGNKAASRDFSSPSVSPEARGSPFPEDAYMSFVPVMPTKAPSMIPEIIPLAPRVSSGVPSATPKPTVSAKPVPPPAHGSLIAKPASLSSMKEETVALHWGFPLAAYTELKKKVSELAETIQMDLAMSLEGNKFLEGGAVSPKYTLFLAKISAEVKGVSLCEDQWVAVDALRRVLKLSSEKAKKDAIRSSEEALAKAQLEMKMTRRR